MTAVGVRLGEAPAAPSRGEAHFRIPSGQRPNRQWRVAFGDIQPSGDIQALHAPPGPPRRGRTRATTGWMRTGTGLTECTGTGLIDQDGGKSGSDATLSGMRSLFGDPAPWKDPL